MDTARPWRKSATQKHPEKGSEESVHSERQASKQAKFNEHNHWA